MNNLKELSELAWQGELDTKFEHHPVHTFYEGSTELAENLLGLKGIGGFYVVAVSYTHLTLPTNREV